MTEKKNIEKKSSFCKRFFYILFLILIVAGGVFFCKYNDLNLAKKYIHKNPVNIEKSQHNNSQVLEEKVSELSERIIKAEEFMSHLRQTSNNQRYCQDLTSKLKYVFIVQDIKRAIQLGLPFSDQLLKLEKEFKDSSIVLKKHCASGVKTLKQIQENWVFIKQNNSTTPKKLWNKAKNFFQELIQIEKINDTKVEKPDNITTDIMQGKITEALLKLAQEPSLPDKEILDNWINDASAYIAVRKTIQNIEQQILQIN